MGFRDVDGALLVWAVEDRHEGVAQMMLEKGIGVVMEVWEG
jgi:hypothetical protein